MADHNKAEETKQQEMKPEGQRETVTPETGATGPENRDLCDVKSVTSSLSESTADGEDIRPQRLISPQPDSRETSCPSTPRSCSTTPPPRIAGSAVKVNPRFPVRVGIDWQPGFKVEAKDFMDKWYMARIVEMDESDLTVLIHFEGWNSRYDEWVEMHSDRLRPLARHSERKDKRGSNIKSDYKIGECVFAKWTDCRLYAARIIDLSANGSFDVLFYDGFKKTVQPINIKPMPPEVQKEYGNLGLLPPPLKKVKKNPAGPPTGPGKEASKERIREKQSKDRTDGKDTSPKEKEAETLDHVHHSTPPTPTPGSMKRKKLIGTGALHAKRTKKEGIAEKLHKRIKKEQKSMTKSQEEKESPAAPPCEEREKQGEEMKAAVAECCAASEPQPEALPGPSTQSDCPDTAAAEVESMAMMPQSEMDPKVFAKREFKVEDDHNKYKCPWENCGKGFRKMSLVEYHIKYYHSDNGRPPPPPYVRRRNKTLSVCSTDSEISIGGRSTSSKAAKRKRESTNSISSVPDISVEGGPPLPDESFTPLDEDTRTTEEYDPKDVTEESLDVPEEARTMSSPRKGGSKDEVVSCICQLNEENGLMIQCDVCLCWQHANCMELTEDTLPKKYVCYICANPPGVRDSARFIYNQDWHKDGNLASFSFLPPSQKIETSQKIEAAHDLTGDVHGIHQVLASLRRKLHVLQDKKDPELELWTKNWDREMEKRKQEEEKLAREEERRIAEEQEKLKTHIKSEPNEVNEETVTFFIGDIGEKQHKEDKQLKCPEQSQSNANRSMESDDKDNHVMTKEDKVAGEGVWVGASGLESRPSGVTKATVCPMSTSSSATELHDYSRTQSSSTRAADRKSILEQDSAEELESDVSTITAEEDPFANCEKNLLEHVMNMQDRIEDRLDVVEEQLVALEALENVVPSGDMSDIPQLKKAIHQLMNDLVKVRCMARFH